MARQPGTRDPWLTLLLLAPAVALAQTEDVEVEWQRPWASAYGWLWWFVVAAILAAIIALGVREMFGRRPRQR